MVDKPVDDPSAASQSGGEVVPRLPYSSPSFWELANTLIGAIDKVSAAVPTFEDSRVSREFVERKLRVPASFVTEAVSALLVEPELRSVNTLSSDRTLLRKQYIDAFLPLLNHMDVATKELRFNIEAQQALLAADAQQIYGFAKVLAQDRDTSSVSVYVGNMKRALRAARRKKRVRTAAEPGTTESQE
jgi:DNA-binding protein H-NS